MRFSLLVFLLLAAPAFATDVPIVLLDGLIWTKVRCHGRTLNFVVDTGAGSTVVSSAVSRATGLATGASVSVASIGGRAKGYLGSQFDGSIGGVDLPRNVLVLDLRAASRVCSQPIDGLVGADFFKGRVVQIDCANRVMRCGSRDESAAAASTRSVPLRFENGAMCVEVSVNGSLPRWTRVDTGCVDALLWSSPGTKWPAARDPHSAGSRQGATIAIGSVQVRNVPVKLRTKEIFPNEAGLLGNAVLSKYRVTIDGVDNRLTLDR